MKNGTIISLDIVSITSNVIILVNDIDIIFDVVERNSLGPLVADDDIGFLVCAGEAGHRPITIIINDITKKTRARRTPILGPENLIYSNL